MKRTAASAKPMTPKPHQHTLSVRIADAAAHEFKRVGASGISFLSLRTCDEMPLSIC
jgi:hypothetical protein